MPNHVDRIIDISAVKAQLGRFGLWLGPLGGMSAAAERTAAQRIEQLGYSTLWITESTKEIFAHSALLLAATSRLTIASGIANVWSREPEAAASGATTLAEAFDNRFVLGLGVGHAAFVERYEKPLTKMRGYLDRMHSANFAAPAPTIPAPWLIAALGPKMLELSATRAQGSHPYFVPVEHTAVARSILGADAVLAPEVAVVLDPVASTARATARQYMALYLTLPNYTKNLLTLGFTEQDLSGGGSDRLVDAIVPWGSAEAIATRVGEHFAAGADHVCIQPLDFSDGADLVESAARIAPALIG